MDTKLKEHEPKPIPGWVCAAVGGGVIAFLVVALVGIIILRGS